MQKNKKKFNRRRALICKMVKPSRNNKGYFEYRITVGEKDGTTSTTPAYGKDMQDALKRLLNTELTQKVERKLETSTGFLFLAWVLLMSIPAIFGDSSTPWFLVYVFGSIISATFVAAWWYHYIKKGK